MFKEIPENRPGRASAAWLLHFNGSRPGRVDRLPGVRRIGVSRPFGPVHPTVGVPDGQPPNESASDRSRPRRLVAWILRVGEKLARWKLAWMDYPLDRGN
jgi:hypothetical protein